MRNRSPAKSDASSPPVPGADLEHDALLVERIARHEERAELGLELEPPGLQGCELRLGELADLGVGIAGQLFVLGDRSRGVLPGAIGADQLAQTRELLGQLAQLSRIAGELGLAELVLELLIASFDFGDALEHGSSGRDRLATTDPRGRGEEGGRPSPSSRSDAGTGPPSRRCPRSSACP